MLSAILQSTFSPFSPLLSAFHLLTTRGKTGQHLRGKVLKHGLTRSRRFIPWSDTQRLWRAHLPLDRITFLDRFLPPEEVAA